MEESQSTGRYEDNMFTTIDEAVNWMVSQRNKEIGFTSFQRYLDEHENHLNRLKIIHVAGTNGKGSTTAMLMSCLMEAGYKVGTFTSPHLLKHEDRIRINNVPICEDAFLRLCNEHKENWQQHNLSMFEMDLDLASIWFCEEAVDFVILEAGMGGLHDSTNVIRDSLASVIVTIGLDHIERLGDTLEKIAYEKAGIIKNHGLVITGEKKSECIQVIKAEADKKQAQLVLTDEAEIISESPVVFKTKGLTIELSELALYQVHNACCALETLIQLRDKNGIKISDAQIISGLKKAHWAGRFDVVSHHPLTICDGAHNAHGIAALKQSAQGLKRPLVCVFACLKDKDKHEMIETLMDFCDELILTEFDFYRAMHVDDFQCRARKVNDWKEAIEMARFKAKDGTVLITGSLYFISEVISYFNDQKI